MSGGLHGFKMPLTSPVCPCRSRKPPTTMSSTLSHTDFDSLEIQGQYSDINNRWDLPDSDWDNDSSSARLFERSRIKALAGEVRGGLGEVLRMLGREACLEESFNFMGRPTLFLSCRTRVGNPDHSTKPYSAMPASRTNHVQSTKCPSFLPPRQGEAVLMLRLSHVPLCAQLTAWPLSLSHVP